MRSVYDVLAWAEFLFVACFFASEAVRLALRGWIIRVERTAHAVPQESYQPGFATPMITLIAGIGIAVAVGAIGSGDALQGYTGILVIVVVVFVTASYLLQGISRPPRHSLLRVRLRLFLAETRAYLGSGAPINSADAALLRVRLRRAGEVGDRLACRAGRERLRDAIRNERRRLLAGIALATLLPLAGAGWDGIRWAHGDLGVDALGPVCVLVALSAATVAAALMRRLRHRRDLRDLGTELVTESAALLSRLDRVAPAQPSRQDSRRTSRWRALWSRYGRPRAR